jgi:hypothetical protein
MLFGENSRCVGNFQAVSGDELDALLLKAVWRGAGLLQSSVLSIGTISCRRFVGFRTDN